MEEVLELPFFAPDSRLPAPLPSPDDIETKGEVLQNYTGRRIVRCRNCYIIKFGSNVSLIEGENMLLVRQTQSIPVPEIFALYSIKRTMFQAKDLIPYGADWIH